MNDLFSANPEIIQSSSDLRFLVNYFGPHAGRYLIKYPSHWSELLTHQEVSDLEAEKIKTILRRAHDNLQIITRPNISWQDNINWNENAKKFLIEQLRDISCISHTADHKKFIEFESIDLPPTAEERVLGKEDEYVRVSQILLSLSPELHFIDPYIDPSKRKYFSVLKTMLHAASKGKCKKFIFWTRSSSIAPNTLSEKLLWETKKELEKLKSQSNLSKNVKLELNLLRDENDEEKMHARYLLSIKGGIRFDQGFQRLPQNRKTDITPIGKTLHDQLLDQFSSSSKKRLIEETIIVD